MHKRCTLFIVWAYCNKEGLQFYGGWRINARTRPNPCVCVCDIAVCSHKIGVLKGTTRLICAAHQNLCAAPFDWTEIVYKLQITFSASNFRALWVNFDKFVHPMHWLLVYSFAHHWSFRVDAFSFLLDANIALAFAVCHRSILCGIFTIATAIRRNGFPFRWNQIDLWCYARYNRPNAV